MSDYQPHGQGGSPAQPPANDDIVVSGLGVSEEHAELRRSPTGRYQIIDLGSRNGTYVNGTRVNQAELNEGDIVAVGHATFRLVGGELIEYVDDSRATVERGGSEGSLPR